MDISTKLISELGKYANARNIRLFTDYDIKTDVFKILLEKANIRTIIRCSSMKLFLLKISPEEYIRWKVMEACDLLEKCNG